MSSSTAKKLQMSLPQGTAAKQKKQADAGSFAATIQNAESHDLVLALSGHTGSGIGLVSRKLKAELSQRRYSVHIIKLSDLIQDFAGIPASPNQHERTRKLQEEGNRLRREQGEEFVAALAIHAISKARSGVSGTNAFILDSLKHGKELEFLRSVYKSSFYLIGVTCHESIREKRLELKFPDATTEQRNSIKSTDDDDPSAEGQRVRDVLHLADFFVCNDDANTSKLDKLGEAISRFVRLLLNIEIERPTLDERGMYAAWGASLRSACLSRQVGAAIVDPDGNVLSTGTNEVPKYGGGAYDYCDERIDERGASTSVPIGRCFNGTTGCYNEAEKKKIYADVTGKLRKLVEAKVTKQRLQRYINACISDDSIETLLKRTRVGALLEFSRAVHAEMDAIITIARRGGPPIQGATLYCRTYPCHNCARHIVGAGIVDVVYIEPYRKSLATELHADSLIEGTSKCDPKDKRVSFRIFVGVAPRRYAALFEEKRDLKDSKRSRVPQHKDFLHKLSHLDFETEIATKVEELRQSAIGASP